MTTLEQAKAALHTTDARAWLAAWWPRIALLAVVGTSFALNAWQVSRQGLGNTYYAAAARSMSMSWTNFFFGSFDPGGFITVDKPPVFLWFDALSVRLFGYSSWSLLLPSAVAGALAVGLLWLIVRRTFGVAAATIAALVLAFTPVWVAVDRLNLPEPFYILMLVGAAGATLRSVESERRWWAWAALAGALVGLAFNTKMLAAWIPGPAFALAMVAGVATLRGGLRGTAWRVAVGRLAVLAVATAIVSASWLIVVDAVPASSRPYIGGSTDNSVLNLVLGYNGFGRIEGGSGQPGGGARPPIAAPNGNNNAPGGFGGFTAPQGIGPQGAPQAAPGGGGAGPGGAGARGAGGIIAGTPGPLRMFDEANGGQIAWFLPFAMIGGVFALAQWRRDPLRRASAVLWLGWIVLFAGVFSYAQGIYHSYYTSAIAPGIAALVGIGGVAIVEAIRRRDWRARALGVLGGATAVGVTLGVQLLIASRVPTYFGWMRPVTIVVALAGLGLLVLAAFVRGRTWPTMPQLARLDTRRLALVGLATSACGLVLLPAAWSLSLTTQAVLNTTLPQAGPQGGASAMTFGSQAFDNGTDALAAWLLAHREPGATWDLVTSSSQSGSTLIAMHSVSVLSLGGFSGNDPAITVAGFAELVREGRVRYVLTTQNGPGGVRGAPGVAPDGTTPANPGAVPGGSGRDGRTRPGGAIPGGGTQQAPTTPSTPPGGTVAPGTAPATGGGAFGGGAVFGRGGGVIAAVQQSCTAVTDASLPEQYRGAIYDCANAASALATRAGG